MKVLLTGAAGFIGYHTASYLAQRGDQVLGVDNINNYYRVDVKRARLLDLVRFPNFRFAEADICNRDTLDRLTLNCRPDVIVHLAAQAGVRYSIDNPLAYVEANIVGQVSVFEKAVSFSSPVPVVYASSSSVYGMNQSVRFCERDRVDRPASIYAATKRSAELIATVYAAMYSMRCIGLRFFTVYGRFGRPDMAPWLFTDAILNGRPVLVYNDGTMERDFTHVSDIVDGVVAAVDRIIDPAAEIAPIYNLGNNRPVKVLDLVAAIERATGCKAQIDMRPGPPGEARRTCADIGRATRDLGFAPSTAFDDGIADFVQWFRHFDNAKSPILHQHV